MTAARSWEVIRSILEEADEPLTAADVADRGQSWPSRSPVNYVRTLLWRHASEVRRVARAYVLEGSALSDKMDWEAEHGERY